MISLLQLLIESYEDKKSPEQIVDYIKRITPSDSDVPDYSIKQILKYKKPFIKKKVNIEDLLVNDKSLKSYVDSKEDRYGGEESDYVPYPEELDNPIVIFKNKVVDGYSRVAKHIELGEKQIFAYIS
jgi:hypothetical protein